MSSWKQQHQIIYPAKFPAKNPDNLTDAYWNDPASVHSTWANCSRPLEWCIKSQGWSVELLLGRWGVESPPLTQPKFFLLSPLKISLKTSARSWLNELTLWTFEGQIIVFYELSSDMVKFGQGSPTQILRLYILLQVLSHWKKGQTQTSG